jgi:branched-chain amino acid transport system ATP-binding protein
MLLTCEGVTRRFGGLTAVDDFSLRVMEGEIKAVIGPNGAGKSTLFNLLSGFDRPDSGRVVLQDRDITGQPAHKIAKLGLVRTFQNTRLFDSMSALENVMVGRHTRTRTGMLAAALRLPGTAAEERLTRDESGRLLRLVGLGDQAQTPAADLPQGRRRLLEVARALAAEPKVMLLDEPAAGLNNAETEELGQVLYRIRDAGTTIVVVEHDMGLVMEVSDEVVVLDRGRKIAEGSPLLIQKDPAVIAAYLGEEEVPADA